MAPLRVKLTFTILTYLFVAANAQEDLESPGHYIGGATQADWCGNDVWTTCNTTISQCGALCDGRPDCIGLFFRPDGCCYLKGFLRGYPNSGGVPTTDGSATYAKPPIINPAVGYEQATPANWPGNDIAMGCSKTISGCAAMCDSTRECVGFYLGLDNDQCCWTKSALPGYPHIGGPVGGVEATGLTFAKKTFAQAPAGYKPAVGADWPGTFSIWDNACQLTIAQAASMCNARGAGCVGFFWRPIGCAWFKHSLGSFPNGGEPTKDGGVTFVKL